MTGFDKAVCNVSVGNDGKVTSKRWEMEYDASELMKDFQAEF
jgi:hypothetical protein